jgi:biotin carboxyl carrier protein
MKYDVRSSDHQFDVNVRRDSAGMLWVSVGDGDEAPFHGKQLASGEWRVVGETRPIGAAVAGETVDVTIGGDPFRFTVADARRAALRAGGGTAAGEVRTPMPGAVVRLMVAVGDDVVDGQPVIVVEAMKMENEFKAQMDGVVTAIHVAPGNTLESGALLITIGESE